MLVDELFDIGSMILNYFLKKTIPSINITPIEFYQPDFSIGDLDSFIENKQENETYVFLIDNALVNQWIRNSKILNNVDYNKLSVSRVHAEDIPEEDNILQTCDYLMAREKIINEYILNSSYSYYDYDDFIDIYFSDSITVIDNSYDS